MILNGTNKGVWFLTHECKGDFNWLDCDEYSMCFGDVYDYGDVIDIALNHGCTADELLNVLDDFEIGFSPFDGFDWDC